MEQAEKEVLNQRSLLEDSADAKSVERIRQICFWALLSTALAEIVTIAGACMHSPDMDAAVANFKDNALSMGLVGFALGTMIGVFSKTSQKDKTPKP